MALPQNFEKAQLRVDGGATITVLFNPREYSITKTNAWTSEPVTGTSVPPAEFGGGQPRVLTLNGLLIDKSLLAPDSSVLSECRQLFEMMDLGSRPVPPLVSFAWGAETTFKAVCQSVTVAYKLFQPNGQPIRAEVNLTLMEAQEGKPKAQNPTTRAEAGLGVHTVQDGESLQGIAHRVYGEASRWRTIAEVNRIDNPLHLRRGTALMLPKIDA